MFVCVRVVRVCVVSEWCVHLWSSGMATPSCVRLRQTTLTVPVCVCVWLGWTALTVPVSVCGGFETDNADSACVCVCVCVRLRRMTLTVPVSVCS